jgi:hypothetical protein
MNETHCFLLSMVVVQFSQVLEDIRDFSSFFKSFKKMRSFKRMVHLVGIHKDKNE